MKATWGLDYDYRSDKNYKRPVCPECEVQIVKDSDGQYTCLNCGKTIEVDDPVMIEWFKLREETKTDLRNCFCCGGKKCVKTLYVRNPVTLRWETASGTCSKCNSRFIV